MENFSCYKGRAQQLRQRLEEPQSLGHLLLSTCAGRASPPRLCSGPKEGAQAPLHSSTLFLVPRPHPQPAFLQGQDPSDYCHCFAPSPPVELSSRWVVCSAHPEGTLSPAIKTPLLFREGMRLGRVPRHLHSHLPPLPQAPEQMSPPDTVLPQAESLPGSGFPAAPVTF